MAGGSSPRGDQVVRGVGCFSYEELGGVAESVADGMLWCMVMCAEEQRSRLALRSGAHRDLVVWLLVY